MLTLFWKIGVLTTDGNAAYFKTLCDSGCHIKEINHGHLIVKNI